MAVSYGRIRTAAWLPSSPDASIVARYHALPFPEQWRDALLDLCNTGRSEDAEPYRTVPTHRMEQVLQAVAPDHLALPRPATSQDEPAYWLYVPDDAPLLPDPAFRALLPGRAGGETPRPSLRQLPAALRTLAAIRRHWPEKVGLSDPRPRAAVETFLDVFSRSDLTWPDLARLLTAGRTVVLDGSALEFLDSSGLRVLLRGAKLAESEGAAFRVVAPHPVVQREYRVLAQSLELAASPQIRNLATIGGNLMQRTRCPYFRAEVLLPCNKRTPGSGCAARHGENRVHAIFGWSDACVATHPSDLAVALAALDAVVHVVGASGERAIPAADFHRTPGDDPQRDTMLERGELISGVEVRAAPSTSRSYYLKVRERASYEFAMVSAAVTLELDGAAIRRARIALGGVAHKPWRLGDAERSLAGVAYDHDAMTAAVDGAFAAARPLEHNAFKIALAKRAVVRALELAGGMA